MTHYYVGDIPSEDLVIEPARSDEEPLDLSPFTDVDVELIDPAGVAVTSSGFIGSLTAGAVIIEWPGDTVLAAPGLYALRVNLTTVAGTGPRERLAPIFIVVEQDSGWADLALARDELKSDQISDVKLWRLLEIAKLQVLEYAPAITDQTRPPAHYVEAQLMQAKTIWDAARVDAGGEVGGESFSFSPRPLDWQVKQLLRPKRGVPVAG